MLHFLLVLPQHDQHGILGNSNKPMIILNNFILKMAACSKHDSVVMTTTNLVFMCMLADNLCQLPQPRQHAVDQEVLGDVYRQSRKTRKAPLLNTGSEHSMWGGGGGGGGYSSRRPPCRHQLGHAQCPPSVSRCAQVCLDHWQYRGGG